MPRSRWLLIAALWLSAATAVAEPKSRHLPPVNIKQRVLWGSEATTPEGLTLSFGGMDQDAADGAARTRVVKQGEEVALAEGGDEGLVQARKHQSLAKQLAIVDEQIARARYHYLASAAETHQYHSPVKPEELIAAVTYSIDYLRGEAKSTRLIAQPRRDHALKLALAALEQLQTAGDLKSASGLRAAHQSLQLLTQARDGLAAEPAPRALSPLVYDPHTKLFVLFGGDHLDYVANDLWVFDPQKMSWDLRHPPQAPAPRANHRWKVLEGGKLELTGGYRYTSTTDYMGGQYIDHDDGPWVYDIAKNEWSGKGKLVAGDLREYRTGPFHPDFFLQGDPPDVAAVKKQLDELPANTWVAMKPPYLPQMNRDWGTAVVAGGDLILRWAGGHSAHGGTDVLHYHINTNRWELARPVEFPLGQLYTNTEYPRGVSFNGQAWITGHTYQSYAYDDNVGMLFVGQERQTFIYDPAKASWRTPGQDKPAGMKYDSCFYTLTLCPTDQGVVCWTNEGRVFQWKDSAWTEWKLTGKKLEGSSVDNSTLTYDSQRKRLYFFRKPYGDDNRYDGAIQTLDLATKEVKNLHPAGADAAAQISYLCQIRYDAANDLLLCGCTLPPDESGVRRTPAYDPAKDRWISLKITGEDPSGPKGRNVSLGLMYDAERKLFWGVDAKSQVYALRLKRASADEQLLK